MVGHFCYGDKLWAAYARKPYAIYGEIREDALAKIKEIPKNN